MFQEDLPALVHRMSMQILTERPPIAEPAKKQLRVVCNEVPRLEHVRSWLDRENQGLKWAGNIPESVKAHHSDTDRFFSSSGARIYHSALLPKGQSCTSAQEARSAPRSQRWSAVPSGVQSPTDSEASEPILLSAPAQRLCSLVTNGHTISPYTCETGKLITRTQPREQQQKGAAKVRRRTVARISLKAFSVF